jgi:hypothetical protein
LRWNPAPISDKSSCASSEFETLAYVLVDTEVEEMKKKEEERRAEQEERRRVQYFLGN